MRRDAVKDMNKAAYNRSNPFLAELLHQEPLTKAGSNKDTRHFVLSLKGSGIHYTPGDSLAIFARNPEGLVDRVIELLGFNESAEVREPRTNTPITFRQALTRNYILNRANRKFLTGTSERIHSGEQRNRLMEILNNDEVAGEYLHTRDYVDILEEFSDATFESPENFLA